MSKCPLNTSSLNKLKKYLNHNNYRVRPEETPVPKIIQHSLLGDIFSKLIRMRDDENREPVKQALTQALTQALNSYTYDAIFNITQNVAKQNLPKTITAEGLNTFLATLPVYVLGTLLGYKPEQWQQLAYDAHHFSCTVLSLHIKPHEISAQIESTERLYYQIEQQNGELFVLFSQYAQQHKIVDKSLLISNLMGLFFQISDSTTALIGLTLIETQKGTEQTISSLIEKVLNEIVPIKQTKRFKSQNNSVDEIAIPLLTRDGALPFGYGKHRCPGEHIARAMGCSAVKFILQQKYNKDYFTHYRWKTSTNAQIPLFYLKQELSS